MGHFGRGGRILKTPPSRGANGRPLRSGKAPPTRSLEYVFSVAQIANLLYRRLQIGRALAVFRRPGQGAVLQDGILRYRRLAVCATNTTEALNRYSLDWTGPFRIKAIR